MKRMTEKVLIKTDPALKNRLYQVESLMNILNLESEKCLVKMFCGTGKSRIITNVIIHEKKTLNVIVFPSLALIIQYSMDYLNNDEYKKHFKAKEVPMQFCYNSGNNDQWETVESIRKLIKEYVDPNFVV